MFDNIKNKLKSNATLVENALNSYYSDNEIYSLVLTESQKYGLLGGGKRIRAFLTIELCRILGADISSAIPYACAIEMVHASSLIHDDMPCMDNDDFRRGKPAVHKQFGETAALLAGDALMMKAFEVISENNSVSPELNIKAISLLARGSGDRGMLAGQGIDMLSANKTTTLDELVLLHNLKTGKLITASALLGCLAAKIDEQDDRYIAATKFAECLGLAFQITDDILDYKDGKNEDNSFLAFMTLNEAMSYAKNLTDTAIKAIAPFDDGTLQELACYLTVREY